MAANVKVTRDVSANTKDPITLESYFLSFQTTRVLSFGAVRRWGVLRSTAQTQH